MQNAVKLSESIKEERSYWVLCDRVQNFIFGPKQKHKHRWLFQWISVEFYI